MDFSLILILKYFIKILFTLMTEVFGTRLSFLPEASALFNNPSPNPLWNYLNQRLYSQTLLPISVFLAL